MHLLFHHSLSIFRRFSIIGVTTRNEKNYIQILLIVGVIVVLVFLIAMLIYRRK